MEAENLMNLYDSYWYDNNFFKKSKPRKDIEIPKLPSSNNTPKTLPNIQINSPKNEKTTDFSSSPNSVLQSPKLQTIFSGKEQNYNNNNNNNSLKGSLVISQKRKKKRLSKSLSDLEFEELKGFMDLGFVFSENDKDSNLATIIPGLQRLGVSNENGFSNVCSAAAAAGSSAASRPYLSEAWEVLEKKKKGNNNNLMLNWKVPNSSNQIDMKGYLKSWAHNVASAVK